MAAQNSHRIFVSGKELFEFNLKFLRYAAIWPNDKASKINKLLYKVFEIFFHILPLLFIIFTSIGTYNKKDDAIALLANLDKTLVAYNFVAKALIFFIKRKHLKILIDEIHNSGDNITRERNNMMTMLIVILFISTLSVVGCTSAYSFYKNELLVEAWLPFDPFSNKKAFFMAYQLIMLSFFPCLTRAIAMQGIICSIAMYLCDQLTNMQNRLQSLEYSLVHEMSVRFEFKEIVKKHVRLIRYSNSLSMIFQEYFLVQNLAVTFELCLNALMITVIRTEDIQLVVSFLTFLTVALFNAYIYCYLGNELINQSQKLALAAYNAPWTSWPVDLQKDLLLMIRTAQKPLHLSVGGISPMSLQTYCETLYNGYSVFAVLNDIVD